MTNVPFVACVPNKSTLIATKTEKIEKTKIRIGGATIIEW